MIKFNEVNTTKDGEKFIPLVSEGEIVVCVDASGNTLYKNINDFVQEEEAKKESIVVAIPKSSVAVIKKTIQTQQKVKEPEKKDKNFVFVIPTAVVKEEIKEESIEEIIKQNFEEVIIKKEVKKIYYNDEDIQIIKNNKKTMTIVKQESNEDSKDKYEGYI